MIIEVKKINKSVRKGNTADFKDDIIVKLSYINRTDTKLFKIQDIGLNKIKTSVKKLYSEKNIACKYYMGYDYNEEIIPLLIRLPKMICRYKIFKMVRQ